MRGPLRRGRRRCRGRGWSARPFCAYLSRRAPTGTRYCPRASNPGTFLHGGPRGWIDQLTGSDYEHSFSCWVQGQERHGLPRSEFQHYALRSAIATGLRPCDDARCYHTAAATRQSASGRPELARAAALSAAARALRSRRTSTAAVCRRLSPTAFARIRRRARGCRARASGWRKECGTSTRMRTLAH
eukprot:scaffold539_cov359-Prasinococcus_capsulatus_cf.AAC.19